MLSTAPQVATVLNAVAGTAARISPVLATWRTVAPTFCSRATRSSSGLATAMSTSVRPPSAF